MSIIWPMTTSTLLRPGLRWLAAAALVVPLGAAATPAEQLAGYEAAAGRRGAPAQGEAFFTTKHGREWACASCHGAPPTKPGQHKATGKVIAPLAPAFEPARFSESAKSEKWFRRNCNDVVGRECTPGEKADVLAWLMGLKP
jgi:mono/diheme cytochrome c family protein